MDAPDSIATFKLANESLRRICARLEREVLALRRKNTVLYEENQELREQARGGEAL